MMSRFSLQLSVPGVRKGISGSEFVSTYPLIGGFFLARTDDVRLAWSGDGPLNNNFIAVQRATGQI